MHINSALKIRPHFHGYLGNFFSLLNKISMPENNPKKNWNNWNENSESLMRGNVITYMYHPTVDLWSINPHKDSLQMNGKLVPSYSCVYLTPLGLHMYMHIVVIKKWHLLSSNIILKFNNWLWYTDFETQLTLNTCNTLWSSEAKMVTIIYLHCRQ